ncbi:MAG: hypothetical protein F7O42_13725, partial [Opitutae bacterium]|nr:hypothetical protein [Opitutae bacterium]
MDDPRPSVSPEAAKSQHAREASRKVAKGLGRLIRADPTMFTDEPPAKPEEPPDEFVCEPRTDEEREFLEALNEVFPEEEATPTPPPAPVAPRDERVSELPIDPPFDLKLTLQHDQGHRWRRDPKDGWYTSVIGKELVRIRQKVKDGPLEFQPCSPTVEKKLRWQFRLNEKDENKAEYTRLGQDPQMAGLLERYCGLRIMRVDPWECLVFFILSAHNYRQLHVPTRPTADSMDQIAEHFWNVKCWKHDRYPFPSPEELGSESGLEKLRELWFHPKKRRRIRGLTSMPDRLHDAALFVQEDRLDRLKGESIHRTVCELEKIDGVGPKTAHCVALFGLGCMDAFPVDTHVTEAILSLYARNQF